VPNSCGTSHYPPRLPPASASPRMAACDMPRELDADLQFGGTLALSPSGAAESPQSSLRRNLSEAKLNEPIPLGCTTAVQGWGLRPAQHNDAFLRETFSAVLETSAALPPDERLVMYDANEPSVPCEALGAFRKRLDPRRNTKPKKPNEQLLVCTPFNPDGFHFGKISNPRERLLQLQMSSGSYELLTNKFPLFPKHMLLVAKALVPQQMRLEHLQGICELMQACTFCAYFNSWCASASVNHFHCHLIDETPPVAALPLLPGPSVAGLRCFYPQGFPGFCYVFEAGPHAAKIVDLAVREMQADNQPHNLLFTNRHIYVFPKPLHRPPRTFELYPETVGGPELLGSFTVYQHADYEQLSEQCVAELFRLNTAPLPSRLLQRGHGAGDEPVPAAAIEGTSTGSGSAPVMRPIHQSKSIDGQLLRSLLRDKPFPTKARGKSRNALVTTAR